MNILIIDDDAINAQNLKLDIEYVSNRKILVEIVATQAAALQCIQLRRSHNERPYGAFLIDNRLERGVEGIDVMKHLLQESPSTEAILFTGGDDPTVGLRALKAGALDYYHRQDFNPNELLYRLNSIDSACNLGDALVKTNGVHSINEMAYEIAKNSRLFGFERARLWRCIANEKGEIAALQGWAENGNIGLDNFSAIQMQRGESAYTNKILAHPLNIYIFSATDHDDKNYLVKTRGDQGFKPPVGSWAAVKLIWNGVVQAVLMLDNAENAGHEIDIGQQKLILKFVDQAATALKQAEEHQSFEEQKRLTELAQNVSNSIADRDIEVAIKHIVAYLSSLDKAILKVTFKIVLKDELNHTAIYRCVCECGQLCNPTRRRLTDAYIIPHLLNQSHSVSCFFTNRQSLANFRTQNNLLVDRESHALIYVPLCIGDRVTGALILDDVATSDTASDISNATLSQNHVTMLEGIAIRVASSLEMGRLQEHEKKEEMRRDLSVQARLKLEEYVEKGKEDHVIWHLLLIVITMKGGYGLNRACIFLHDKNDFYKPSTAVGYFHAKDTHLDWERNEKTSPTLEEYIHTRSAAFLEMTPLEKWASDRNQPVFVKNWREFQKHFNSQESLFKHVQKDQLSAWLPQNFIQIINIQEMDECVLLPIYVGEHKLGVLYVDNHASNNSITKDTLNRINSLVSFTAQNLNRRQQKNNTQHVIELSDENFEDGELKANLQRICDLALKVTDADLAIIYALDPDTNISETFSSSPTVAAGNTVAEAIDESHNPGGLTARILTEREITARQVDEYTHLIRGKPLNEHILVVREKLKGVIGLAIMDSVTKEKAGVLLLGYRTEPDNVEIDLNQAHFLKRVARRAIRTAWRKLRDKSITRIEVSAHRELMAESLNPNATEESVAKLAARLMRDILGKERVDQESTVYLLQWQPATDENLPQQYRIGYRARQPEFIAIAAEELRQKNLYFGITGLVLKDRPYIIADNVKSDTFVNIYHEANTNTVSEMAVALFLPDSESDVTKSDQQKQRLGVLNVESSQVDVFKEDDKVILQRFASVLAMALENVRQKNLNNVLLEATETIVSPFDLDPTVKHIIEAARKLVADVAAVVIWYIDPDHTQKLHRRSWGSLKKIKYVEESDGSILRDNVSEIEKLLQSAEKSNKSTWFVSDAQSETPILNYVKENNVISYCALPLAVSDANNKTNVVGIMFLNFTQPHQFGIEEQQRLQTLAYIAGASIRDANMAHKMGLDAFISSHVAQAQELAHDLNSQTGLMMSNVARLKRSSLDENQYRWLKNVEEQLEEIKDGLPALQINSSSTLQGNTDHLYDLDLNIIQEIIESIIVKQKEERQLKSIFNLPNEGIKLKANRTLLFRSLRHLLRNALNEKNGVNTIFVSARLSSDKKHIYINIADNGKGLKAEIENKILRGPVWIMDEDGKDRISMGLLFAKNQIELMYGTLQYTGKHDKTNNERPGAVFSIKLCLL